MAYSSYSELNPYMKGILRVAPIKENKETSSIRADNISLGYDAVTLPNDYVAGKTYYKFENDSYYVDPTVTAQTSGTRFVFDDTTSDLLEPITDITDICEINPISINYSKNTMSSENSGRVLENLNMVKDILGRIWDFKIEFPIMKYERYSNLEQYFTSKTQTFTVQAGEATKNVTRYIIWYYAEILTPSGIVKDVFYVGDSSFTDMEASFKRINDADNAKSTPNYLSSFAKNVNINLIGKSSIGGLSNSDYSISNN